MNPAKWLNRPICRLGRIDSWGPSNRVLDGCPDITREGFTFEENILGHTRTCPVVHILKVTHKVAAGGNAAFSPPLCGNLSLT